MPGTQDFHRSRLGKARSNTVSGFKRESAVSRRSKQKGYTLVEIIVAVVITGMLAGVLGTSVYQFSVVTERSTSKLLAVDQVQSTANWFYPDAQRAVDAEAVEINGIDYLNLSVIDPGGTVTYAPGTVAYTMGTITYYNQDSELKRALRLPSTASSTVTIAYDVDVQFTITATPPNLYIIGMDISAHPDGTNSQVRETLQIYRSATGTQWAE